jgi:hypothetical protein
MLARALDPLEGSVIILPGAGLVTLGTFLGSGDRGLRNYWLVILILIVLGVAALFGLSAAGGIGGKSGHSAWWGLLILLYPISWVMGFVSLLFRLIRSLRRCQAA